ncbi:DUF4261 domain-containing protein [Undibacterium sp. Ji22W]|uniref:DUF4261 domain-containing protein n=1 Tax=Undibacterium sp. Ji22W TaxID=3413038 RepID=UPI003BF0047B
MPLALSFILLSEQAEPSESDIQDFVATNWPDLPAVNNFSASEGSIAFDIGGSQVALGIMPAPFPWSDLEGPCATSILWKDAEIAVKAHKAHIIVTVKGELEPIELSKILTQVTAATIHATATALGVYWGNATLLIPKAIFNDFAVEILPNEPPLHIWVDFRVGSNENGLTSGFTTGMDALGHMEFETDNCPETPGELRERFLTLCSYVIENGPVIRDGNTVGANAEEKIHVVYSKSKFGCKGKVMRLVYETSQSKKFKWKFWS